MRRTVIPLPVAIAVTVLIPFISSAQVIQPTGITLQASQQKQFTFTVNGASQRTVWSLNPPGVGTINKAGLYTAPALITTTSVNVVAQYGANQYQTKVLLNAGSSSTGTTGTGSTGTGSTGTGSTGSGNTSSSPILSGSGSSSGSGSGSGSTSGSSSSSSGGKISVTLTPSTPVPLYAAQKQTYVANVTGATNTKVYWSMYPNVGSMSKGTYTAPSVINANMSVTLTAHSEMDSTKSASVVVNLLQNSSPISVAVTPIAPTLQAGQTKQFRSTVTGSTNTAVTWSLNPNVGTISAGGLYSAPASLASQQTVAVIATSQADATRSAAAVVTLQPSAAVVVGISLSPTTASLPASQTQQFTSTVTGATNTAVTWSVVPNVGTVSAAGLYTAPSSISSQQTVSVIATSQANSAKTASASVTLQPPAPVVGISLSPTSTSLGGGSSLQFNSTVTGSSNTAVTWSLSPSLGSVTNGLYTAPATVSSQQVVTLTATSSADSTKWATASITLTPPASVGSGQTVTLPLEVLGANGTTVSTQVTVPTGANLSGAPLLFMQIHGLRFETQASVQVNNTAWMPISDSTVTLQGNATAYGGIGGGFSTLKMTLSLPAGTLTTGTNTISFRFNQTDGRVSGFRVLAFNFIDTNGNQILPVTTFVNDDPSTWQPPSTAASDISAGQNLWLSAGLTVPTSTGTAAIQAHCTDCHAQDGRDLKYFNYSNNSIVARSVFHGLNAQQGSQIASYIRSLNVVNPGRPWNPPYQPGPGLDEGPVSSWAAGAGLDAVLDNDQELLAAMFPNGIQQSVFSPTGNLNQREISIPFQLPDWNQWLPGTHPKDTFGSSAFISSGPATLYQTIRAGLNVGDATSYQNQAGNLWQLQYQIALLRGSLQVGGTASSWTASTADQVYSLEQWGLVKTWEIMNEFQLEGFAQNVFGPQAAPRAWYSTQPFFVSPHMTNITQGATGLRNGKNSTWSYLAFIWYQLQLVLNDSNRRQQGGNPIDWGYGFGMADDMAQYVQPQAALHYLWLIKGLQISDNGSGPDVFSTGFNPAIPNLATQVRYDGPNIWAGVPAATRSALENGIITAYLQVVTSFTPQQFYTGGWANAALAPYTSYSQMLSTNDFGTELWFAIPEYSYFGLDSTLLTQWIGWAQSVWPAANWGKLASATCAPPFPGGLTIECSTETQ